MRILVVEDNEINRLVTKDLIEAVLAAVDAGDKTALLALLDPLHGADVADLLEQISRTERLDLVALWGGQLDGATLPELEEGVRDEIIVELPDHVLEAALEDLERIYRVMTSS